MLCSIPDLAILLAKSVILPRSFLGLFGCGLIFSMAMFIMAILLFVLDFLCSTVVPSVRGCLGGVAITPSFLVVASSCGLF